MSTALVGDGRVFVSARDDRIAGALIYALEAQSGKVLWSRVVRGGETGLAYSDGRVYATSTHNQTEAIDAETGRVDWVAPRGQYGASSPPVVVDGLLLQTSSGFGDDLYANDAETGALVWTANIYSDAAPPAVGEGAAYVSGFCRGSSRIDLETGEVAWNTSRGGAFSCSAGRVPVFGDGEVFVREDDSTPPEAVLDSEDGAVARAFESQAPPVLADDLVLTVVGGAVEARERDGGELVWRFQENGDPVRVAPIVIGDRVAIASWSGELRWLDLRSGSVVWSKRLDSTASELESNFALGMTPEGLSAGGGLLLQSADGVVSSFDIGSVDPPSGGNPSPGGKAPPANESAGSVAYRLNAAHDATVDDGAAPPLRKLWDAKGRADRSSYPLIAGGSVFTLTEGDGEAEVIARSRKSGKVLWSHQVPQNTENIGKDYSSGLAFDAGTVYLANSGPDLEGTKVIALDAGRGSVQWEHPLNAGSTAAPPVADRGLVYATTPGTLHALDGASGDLAWERSLRLAGDSSPSVVGDRVIVSYECDEAYALDRLTGETIWDWSFGSCRTSEGGQTAPVRRDRVYSDDGRVLDLWDGDLVGFHPGFEAQPALGSRITVTRLGETLVASDGATGLEAWTFRGKGKMTTNPVIVGDFAYVATDRKRLYALRLRDGKVAWQGRLPAAPEPQLDYSPWSVSFAADRNTLVVPLVEGGAVAYAIGR